jgi:hypothetical protein
MEEHRFVVGFHQRVQKSYEKSWHDRYIKQKKFWTRDLVFLHENKFLQHPGKFQMHWLVSYVMISMKDVGVFQLGKLNRKSVERLVNESRMKMYRDNRDSTH